MPRSLNPKHLNLDNTEIKAQLKEQIKSGQAKKIPISQMDAENPGGFIDVTEDETQQIITGKMRDRIRLQERLRELEIAQSYRNAEVESLMELYDRLVEGLKKKPESMSESDYCAIQGWLPKWYGLPMPKKVLVMEINTKIHNWKELMRERNYQYKALKNVGFTNKELTPILTDGKILTDHDKMKRLEEAHEKKRLKDEEVDAV